MRATRCVIGRARPTGRSSCKIRATSSSRPAGTAPCARSRWRPRGWIPELIARSEEVDDEFRLLGRETDRAMHLLANPLRGAEASGWRITADGIDLSGTYLAVEILNIRFVGPNVPLAPAGDPSDGLLDVVLVTDADRDGILEYLDQRLNLASGVMPQLRTARARVIDLAVPAGTRLHVDDREWPSGRDLDEPIELTVRCLPGAVGLRASA